MSNLNFGCCGKTALSAGPRAPVHPFSASAQRHHRSHADRSRENTAAVPGQHEAQRCDDRYRPLQKIGSLEKPARAARCQKADPHERGYYRPDTAQQTDPFKMQEQGFALGQHRENKRQQKGRKRVFPGHHGRLIGVAAGDRRGGKRRQRRGRRDFGKQCVVKNEHVGGVVRNP